MAVKPAPESKVMIDLSISIVSYNTKDLLKQCIESIYKETKDISFKIFVVDNASDDGTVEMVRSSFPSAKLIANKDNRGFAAANNQAIKESKGRYIVLLNPDTVILDSALDKLVSFMDGHPEAAVVGPQILNPDKTFQFSYDDGISLKRYFRALILNNFSSLLYSPIPPFFKDFYRKHRSRSINYQGIKPTLKIREVGRVRGCCFLVRRDTIDQVGLIDEQFFLYAEEVDWAYRIRKTGWKVYFFPFAYIIHYWGQSTIQVKDFSLITHHKSNYKYFRKHYGNYAVFLLRCMLLASAIFHTASLLKGLLLKKLTLEEVKHQLKLPWKAVLIRY